MASPITFPKFRAFTAAGVPLAGGKVHTYASGTSTAKATYTTAALETENANPVILDANGEAQIWGADGEAYKIILKNASDETQWTVDGITLGSGGTASVPPNVNLIDNGGVEVYDTDNRPANALNGTTTAKNIVDRWWGYRAVAGGVVSPSATGGMPGYIQVQRAASNTAENVIYLGQMLPVALFADIVTATVGGGRGTVQSTAVVQNNLIFSAFLKDDGAMTGTVTLEIVSASSAQNICSGTWTVEASTTVLASELSSSEWSRHQVVQSGALSNGTATHLGFRVKYTPVGTDAAPANDGVKVTGCKAEASSGTTATPYILPHFYDSLDRCRRWYRKFGNGGTPLDIDSYGGTSQVIAWPVHVSPVMAATPAAAVTGTWTVSNCGQPSAANVGTHGFTLNVTVTNAGAFTLTAGSGDFITLDAETQP